MAPAAYTVDVNDGAAAALLQKADGIFHAALNTGVYTACAAIDLIGVLPIHQKNYGHS